MTTTTTQKLTHYYRNIAVLLALLVMFTFPGNQLRVSALTVKPRVKPVFAIETDTARTPASLPFNSPAQSTLAIPQDNFADVQWNLQSIEKYRGASGLFAAHGMLVNHHDVVVAVVDSGVLTNHEDLNFLPGYDFIDDPDVANDRDGRDHDPSDPGDWVSDDDIKNDHVSSGCPIAKSKWHGTAIAGIIGATRHNQLGIAGGANVSMVPVRVTGKCGGYVKDLIDGIRWAAGLQVKGVADNQFPADVINLSVGFPGACSNALQRAINDVVDHGAVVVTAATNSAADLDSEPYSPAVCDNVITVAASERNGSVASYSALGDAVSISAPGGTVHDGIITTQNDGSELPLDGSAYGYHYGTSIAAAHVSAAVATMLSEDPTLTSLHIQYLLSQSSHPINDKRCANDKCGYGSLNAERAMQLLLEDTRYTETPEPTSTQSTLAQAQSTPTQSTQVLPTQVLPNEALPTQDMVAESDQVNDAGALTNNSPAIAAATGVSSPLVGSTDTAILALLGLMSFIRIRRRT